MRGGDGASKVWCGQGRWEEEEAVRSRRLGAVTWGGPCTVLNKRVRQRGRISEIGYPLSGLMLWTYLLK